MTVLGREPEADAVARPVVDSRHSERVLRQLDLQVNPRLDGLLQGDYQGLLPGPGSEPGESRVYRPGDDGRGVGR